MRSDNTLILTSCSYNDLAKHSKVFNSSQLLDYLWIYLNPEDVRESYFVASNEVNAESQGSYDPFERVSTSWLRASVAEINTSIGLHIYRFQFVDRITGDSFSVYANYLMQREDEEKSYIYMKRDQSL